jgi:hypothetical protein
MTPITALNSTDNTNVRHQIFVPLLNDPAALRETDAVPAGDGKFRLVEKQTKQEPLLFKRGEIVECEICTVPGGAKGLVAMRSFSAEPEFKKTQRVFAVFGAIFGAGLGAIIALWVEPSVPSVAIGGAIGAVGFAFCSIRWGDAAWETLSRVLRWL